MDRHFRQELEEIADELGAADCSEPDEVGEVIDRSTVRIGALVEQLVEVEHADEAARTAGALVSPTDAVLRELVYVLAKAERAGVFALTWWDAAEARDLLVRSREVLGMEP